MALCSGEPATGACTLADRGDAVPAGPQEDLVLALEDEDTDPGRGEPRAPAF